MTQLQVSVVDKLREILPWLDIVTPDSPRYAKSIERQRRNKEKPAAIVSFPTSSKEVATLVRFSRDQSLDLAVCGGRHSAIGASSTDGGLCIDLSKMNEVTVDPSTLQVRVQGGALWRDIYRCCDESDVAVVGGACSSVGVGGLGLMGGYGWLTAAHGLAVDNIIEAEMVLADGSTVTASSAEHQDLYWAVRGAGPCFGIATSIVFQGYKTGLVWNGSLVFPLSALPRVVDFINQVLGVSKGEGCALPMIGKFPGMAAAALVVLVYYDGPESEAKRFFAPLIDLGPMANTAKMVPFAKTAIDDAPHSGVVTCGAIMHPMDPGFLDSLLQDYHSLIEHVPDASGTFLLLESHPTSSIMRHSQTETAFPNRGTFSILSIFTKYTKMESVPACRDWCRVVHDKIQAEFERRKFADGVDDITKLSVGEYINYDGLGESPKRLYGVNYETLVRLKKKYDPENVFNKCVDLLRDADSA